jgi:hypothetical protein
MDKKNILRLTNSPYIEFEFNIELEKHKLPIISNYSKLEHYTIDRYYCNYKYDIKCFKMKEKYDRTKFRYKIVSSNLDIIQIINEIKPYLNEPITLIINKNCQSILMLKLIELDCFPNIIFGKQFDIKNYNFTSMKNTLNIICTKCNNLDLSNLPKNLNILRIQVGWRELKLIEIPSNTKKLFISNSIDSNKYLLNMEGVNVVNKILFVDNFNEIVNGCNYEFLMFNINNSHIDFTNLPFTLKILYLYDGFNKCLDYLPDSIEKIIFDGAINSNLSNLPSSVKSIEFRFLSPNQIDKLKELPDSIEIIYLMNDALIKLEPIKYLPKKLCLVKIERISRPHIIRAIENYKRENNLNFVIEIVEQSIISMVHTINSIYEFK